MTAVVSQYKNCCSPLTANSQQLAALEREVDEMLD